MIPVKIQCECGQRYAFEVEPVEGRLPSAVACPVCGADGTAAGNAAIGQSVSAQPTTAAPRGTPLRVAVAAHSDHPAEPAAPTAPRRSPRLPGQVERSQAEHEARAKISWGDPPQEVITYLMVQGFSAEEASALVTEMFRERAATIRGDGIKKIVIGIALMCVPIVVFFIFMSIGVIYTKILAITIMLGLFGACGWQSRASLWRWLQNRSRAMSLNSSGW